MEKLGFGRDINAIFILYSLKLLSGSYFDEHKLHAVSEATQLFEVLAVFVAALTSRTRVCGN